MKTDIEQDSLIEFLRYKIKQGDLDQIKDIEKLSSKRIAIRCKRKERLEVLGEKVPWHLSQNFSDVKYDHTISGSSVGGVRCGGQTIIAKPLKGETNVMANETAARQKLDRDIKKAQNDNRNMGINVVVLDNKKRDEPVYFFDNVYGAVDQPKTPKADFSLRNKNYKRLCYISHKSAGGARAFQQYSGIAERSDGSVSGSISRHGEVEKFKRDIVSAIDEIVHNKARYFRVIKDKLLMERAIFGGDYGKDFGLDNVHFIAQGIPKLVPYEGRHKELLRIPNLYQLKFSEDKQINGDLNKYAKDEDYKPILLARYTAGRTFTIDGKTYRNVRIVIAPKILAKARQIVEI